MDLKDAQCAVLEPFFKPKSRLEKRGRPPQDARGVLNAVLWVLEKTMATRMRRDFTEAFLR